MNLQKKLSQAFASFKFRLMENKNGLTSVPRGKIRAITGFGEDIRFTLVTKASLKKAFENDENLGTVYTVSNSKGHFAYLEDFNRYIKIGENFNTLDELILKLQKDGSKYLPQIVNYDPKHLKAFNDEDEIINESDLKELRTLIRGNIGTKEEMHIVVKNGKVYLFNYETYIELKKGVSIKQDFSVSAKDFASLKGSKVSITDTTLIDENLSEVNLSEHLSIDVSALNTKHSNYTKIGTDLNKILKLVVGSADKNNPKFELNGILFDVQDDKTVLVATDTIRLTTYNIETSLNKGQFIIPKSLFAKVSDMQSISVSDDGYYTFIEGRDYNYGSKLIQGKFPEYQRIIPKHFNYELNCNTSDFKKLLKDVKESTKFTINGGLVEIETFKKEKNEGYHYKDNPDVPKYLYETMEVVGSINVENKNDDRIEIALNPRYLLEAIAGSKSFILKINENNLPFSIQNDKVNTVIMPVVL